MTAANVKKDDFKEKKFLLHELDQVRYLDLQIRVKLNELDDLKNLLVGVKSLRENTSSNSAQTDLLGNTVAKIIDMEQELNIEIDELVDLKKLVRTKISLLKDPNAQAILTSRYILCKNWDDIALDTYYCRMQIYRIHKKALADYEKIKV